MAQEYTYIPAFVTPPHRAPARSRFPSPEPAKEYYRYDAGNAGRLTSAPPKYQQAYVPATVCPANVVYLPVFFQTPNVPAHCVPAFYAENPNTAPVFMTYPQPYAHYSSASHHATVPSGIAWQGSTKAEVDMQNRAIHAAHAKPHQLAPYKPSTYEQFWCRELDGSYTLRTAKEIQEELQPGKWEPGKKGVPYFIRLPK